MPSRNDHERNQTPTQTAMSKENVDQIGSEMEREHQEKHRPDAGRYGTEDGEMNLPRLVGDSLHPYVARITTTYDAMRQKVILLTGFTGLGIEGRTIGIHADRRIAERRSHAVPIGERLRTKKIDYRRLKALQYPWRWFGFLVAAMVSLVFGRFVYDAAALEGVVGNLLYAVILSLGIATAANITAHLTPTILALGRTTMQKWVICIAWFALHILVFALIAIVREEYIAGEQAADTSGAVFINPSAWVFTILNFFVWIAEVLLYRAWPTNEQWKARAAERELKVSLLKDERQLGSIQRVNEGDAKDTLHAQLELHRTMVATQDLLTLVDVWCAESVTEYMRENQLRRPDHGSPSCFKTATNTYSYTTKTTTP
jgi:hypothetical protein